MHINPFADEGGSDVQVNDSPAVNPPVEVPQPQPVPAPMTDLPSPEPQKILPPEEPTYVNSPTPPVIPDTTGVQNAPQTTQPQQTQGIDPDVADSQTLEPLKTEQNQPQNSNLPQPPIHDNCHCEIVTMPGGNQIWRAGNKPCVDCANARESFNSQQPQTSNI